MVKWKRSVLFFTILSVSYITFLSFHAVAQGESTSDLSLNASRPLKWRGKTDIYLEAQRSSIDQNGIGFARIRQLWGQNLQPYLGAIGQSDEKSRPGSIYNESYMAPIAGLQYQPQNWPVFVFAELRYIRSYFNAQLTPWDNRAGIVLGTWRSQHLVNDLNFIQDIYGEAIFSSRSESNYFFNIRPRVGIESMSWSRPQLFTELFAKTDSRGLPFERKLEARAGLQLSWSLTQMLFMKLQGHHAWGRWLDQAPRSDLNSAYNEWAGLATLGGQL